MIDKNTRLAYDRTWLAYERTVQAWTRTAMSLITFGFSVYKLADIVDRNPENNELLAPHIFGYLLVGIGFAALVMATLEYRQNISALRQEYGQSPNSMSVRFAALIALLGVFALITMIV